MAMPVASTEDLRPEQGLTRKLQGGWESPVRAHAHQSSYSWLIAQHWKLGVPDTTSSTTSASHQPRPRARKHFYGSILSLPDCRLRTPNPPSHKWATRSADETEQASTSAELNLEKNNLAGSSTSCSSKCPQYSTGYSESDQYIQL